MGGFKLAINAGTRKRNCEAPVAKTPLNKSGGPKSTAAAKPVAVTTKKKRGLFRRRKSNAPTPAAAPVPEATTWDVRDEEDGTKLSDDWCQTSREKAAPLETFGTYDTVEGSLGTLDTGEPQPSFTSNFLDALGSKICGVPHETTPLDVLGNGICGRPHKSTLVAIPSEEPPSPGIDDKPETGSEFVNELGWLQGTLCGANSGRSVYSQRAAENVSGALDNVDRSVVEDSVKLNKYHGLIPRAARRTQVSGANSKKGSRQKDEEKSIAEPSVSKLSIPKPAAVVKSFRAKAKPSTSPSPLGGPMPSEQVIVEVTLDHYDAVTKFEQDVRVMGNEIAQLEEEKQALLSNTEESNVAFIKKDEEVKKLQELVRSVTQTNSELQQAIQEKLKQIEEEQAMREKALLEKNSLATSLHDMERQLLKSKARNGISISDMADMVMGLINYNKADQEDFTTLADDEIDDATNTVVLDAHDVPRIEKIEERDIDEKEDDDGKGSYVTGRSGFWTTLSPVSMYSSSVVTENRDSVDGDDSLLRKIDTFESSTDSINDHSNSADSLGQFSRVLREIIEKDLEDADKTSQNNSKRNSPFARMSQKLLMHETMKGQTKNPAPTMAGVTPPTLKFHRHQK
mmetsp:Transcript_36070/g.85964  ORF Transcript_36070/g.85964 Transcript_36070/m.85964 type:complete len:626 (+) Transcript_36070:199-2076(+)